MRIAVTVWGVEPKRYGIVTSVTPIPDDEALRLKAKHELMIGERDGTEIGFRLAMRTANGEMMIENRSGVVVAVDM